MNIDVTKNDNFGKCSDSKLPFVDKSESKEEFQLINFNYSNAFKNDVLKHS